MRRAAIVALVCVAVPAYAGRVVAVAPMSTLGAEDKSAATRKLVHQVEQAIGTLPDTKVVSANEVSTAIKKAHKPELHQCDGEASCLAELGKLVGAEIVITGEVGGLGASRVVYLSATDVDHKKELSSTTLAVGAKDDGGGPAGAVVRLLDPDHYLGKLHFTIDAKGATVYVNGTKVKPGNGGELTLPVGTQAVRVTHPEYHDFVRFVDVTYGTTVEVPVNLLQYPIVEHDVRAKPTSRDKIEYVETPLWRRWYVAGPAIVVLAVGAGIIAGALAHNFPGYDACKQVGSNGC